MLLEQDLRAAASRTFWTAGSSRPMSTAMIAITTSSSISVKPDRRDGRVMTWTPPLEGQQSSSNLPNFNGTPSPPASPFFRGRARFRRDRAAGNGPATYAGPAPPSPTRAGRVGVLPGRPSGAHDHLVEVEDQARHGRVRRQLADVDPRV